VIFLKYRTKSTTEESIHETPVSKSYRKKKRKWLRAYFPESVLFDPWHGLFFCRHANCMAWRELAKKSEKSVRNL